MYSEFEFEGDDDMVTDQAVEDNERATPEPLRSAKEVAHKELESVERKVLQQMMPESGTSNLASSHDSGGKNPAQSGTYSDFEGSDAGDNAREAQTGAISQGEDSVYEDDYEAEESAYSDDGFEVEGADENEDEEANEPESPVAIEEASGRNAPELGSREVRRAGDEESEYSEPAEEEHVEELEEVEESDEQVEELEERYSEPENDTPNTAPASPSGRTGDQPAIQYGTPSEASRSAEEANGSVASYDNEDIEVESGASHPSGH
mmetsp:Transcript_42204/g.78512  ORF Transcript_42204/g.78512 Transcript_42204/m.78512 type:complete len:264 (-) Transcript_42204:160-951(-)